MSGRLGVAVVGCAHRPHAWSYARALSSSSTARLVGVYDASHDLARAVADDFGAPVHDDVMSLIGASEVAAVIVCSATVEHRGYVEMAAGLGRHVLCEKPIATTLDDARAMIAACDAAGVQLHQAFVTRFHPLVARVREMVVAGELGDLIGLVAGNRGRPPLPPQYPAWITTATESGGGALMDHSVHLTDVVRHLTGREVTTVTAEAGALIWDCGIDDAALLSLVLGDGPVASLDPSWSVPADNPWDYDFYLRLVGSKGSLDISDLAESLQLVSKHWGSGLRLVPFATDVDARLVEAFVASVRAGEVLGPCATGRDGLRAIEVALAAYRSAESHTTVVLTRGEEHQ